MGAFYGSVQVRTDDRGAVQAAVAKLAAKQGNFLLGPALRGWVGVYPEGGGQDFGIASKLAKRLATAELIAVLVHDDDVFAYEYYRNGKRVDQYNSVPDYFGEASKKQRRDLRGEPEAFAHLATDPARFRALADRLAVQHEDREVFVGDLLEEFAAVLGIPNALTSYEYLRDEESDGIEAWDEFLHVPDLSSEKAQKRAAEAAIVARKHALVAEGTLLAEVGGLKGFDSPHPWWCPSPDGDGFLVAWSTSTMVPEDTLALERHAPPWSSGPTPTPWKIGGRIYGMELSGSGRYLAVGHAGGRWQATLWDLHENRLVSNVPQVRAVDSVGFLADESAMFSASSHGEEGRVILTPVSGGESRILSIPQAKLAAAHPSGRWLVVTDNLSRLLVVDLASGEVTRTRFVGGRYAMSDMGRLETALVGATASTLDLDAIEQDSRKHMEKMIAAIVKSGNAKEIATIDDLRREFEKQLVATRIQFEKLANPRPQGQPERGTEGVHAIRFDPTGDRLCLGTSRGVRAYPWGEILDRDGDLARPSMAVDLGRGPSPSEPNATHGYVYDLDHDPGRDRLIFGGLDGRVRFIELATGHSGILLEPPVLEPILRVGLSRDRRTLALTSKTFAQGRQALGSRVQFWDYLRISRA